MTEQTSQPLTEQQLTGAICDAITAFQLTAQYASLQHAQMRQYLAEHLAAALAPEVNKLRAELAEYEVLNPQQCPAGKHADWLVDSEYAHACPWCQIEALKGAAVDTRQLDDQAVQILSNEGAQCGACGDEPGDRTCPDCEKCRAGYVAALRAGGWAPRVERDLAPVEDTLPAWLAQRFDPRGPEWSALTEDDRTYWEHHAAAVRRAVARGGFKAADGAQR